MRFLIQLVNEYFYIVAYYRIITNILLLGYFRINDPYRLVIIFFCILLLFRLPYLISSDWLSNT
jgi:hypothetical protein